MQIFLNRFLPDHIAVADNPRRNLINAEALSDFLKISTFRCYHPFFHICLLLFPL